MRKTVTTLTALLLTLAIGMFSMGCDNQSGEPGPFAPQEPPQEPQQPQQPQAPPLE